MADIDELKEMTQEQLIDEVARERLAARSLMQSFEDMTAQRDKLKKDLLEEHERFLATHRLNLELASRNVDLSRRDESRSVDHAVYKGRMLDAEAFVETASKLFKFVDRSFEALEKAVTAEGELRRDFFKDMSDQYKTLRNLPSIKRILK